MQQGKDAQRERKARVILDRENGPMPILLQTHHRPSFREILPVRVPAPGWHEVFLSNCRQDAKSEALRRSLC